MNKKIFLNTFNGLLITSLSVLTVFGLVSPKVEGLGKEISSQANSRVPDPDATTFTITQNSSTTSSINVTITFTVGDIDTGIVYLIDPNNPTVKIETVYLYAQQSSQNFVIEHPLLESATTYNVHVEGMYTDDSATQTAYDIDTTQTISTAALTGSEIAKLNNKDALLTPIKSTSFKKSSIVPPTWTIDSSGIVVTPDNATLYVENTINTFNSAQFQFSVAGANLWGFVLENFDPSQTSTEINIADLASSTDYDVRMVSIYDESTNNNNETSAIQSFPSLFETLAPYNDATITALTVNPIGSMTATANYTYNIGTTGNGSVQYNLHNIDAGTNTGWLAEPPRTSGNFTIAIEDLDPETNYQVMVQAPDSNSFQSANFRTVALTPAIVASVGNTNVTRTTAELTYLYTQNDGTGEVEYSSVSATSGFVDAPSPTNIDGTANNIISLTSLSPADNYTYWIRAKDNPISIGSTNFTTLSTPAAVTAVTVPIGTVTNNTAIVNYTFAQNDGTLTAEYNYYITANGIDNANWTPTTTPPVNGPGNTINLTGLAAGTNYTVVVRPADTDAIVNSQTATFLTTGSSLASVSNVVVIPGSVTTDSAVINYTFTQNSGTLATQYNFWITEDGINNSNWINVPTAPIDGSTTNPVVLNAVLNPGENYTISVRPTDTASQGNSSSVQFDTDPLPFNAPIVSNVTVPTASITETSATVNFTYTQNDGNNIVQYSYDDTNWTEINLNTEQPTFDLTGLTPSTTYTIVVRPVDAVNNGAEDTFATATPPFVEPEVSSVTIPLATITATGAVVNFSYTQNGGNGRIEYSYYITTPNDTWTAIDLNTDPAQTFTLSSLTPNSLYTIVVRPIDYPANLAQNTFTTLPIGQPGAVVSSSLESSTPNSALIFFNYDIGTIGQGNVEYNLDDTTWIAYPGTITTGLYDIQLTGLDAGESYQIVIRDVDSQLGSELDFTTPPNPDPILGLVTNVSASNMTTNSVTINYTYTINQGDGNVEYQVNYGNWILLTPPLTADGNYFFEIEGLISNRQYVVSVRAVDSEIGGQTTFRTVSLPQSVVSLTTTKQAGVGLLVTVETTNIIGTGVLNVYQTATSTSPITAPLRSNQIVDDEYEFTIIGLDLSIAYFVEFTQGNFKSSRYETRTFANNNDVVSVETLEITSIDPSGTSVNADFSVFLPTGTSDEIYRIALYDGNGVLQQLLEGNLNPTTKALVEVSVEFINLTLADGNWYVVLEIEFDLGGTTFVTTPIVSEPTNFINSSSSLMWLWILLGVLGGLALIGLVVWNSKKSKTKLSKEELVN